MTDPRKLAEDAIRDKCHCGSLEWTVEQHGRITHKDECPARTEPWCQTHPKGCHILHRPIARTLARELLAALDREAELKDEVDGMARAPYGEYQNMRERAEAAEARADALEGALRKIVPLLEGINRSDGIRTNNSTSAEQIAREALAAHTPWREIKHKREALGRELQEIQDAFLDGSFTLEMHERQQELRAAYKQALVDERLASGDVPGALTLFGSEAVAGAIAKLAPALPTDQLRDIVRDEWTRCEAHREVRAEFVEIFKRVGFVTDIDGEWSETKTLPKRLDAKTISIYRGNLGEEEPAGISWTLKKETAQFFVRHHMGPRGMFLGTYRADAVGTVWSAKVDTKDVLAYFDGRGEKEVVVDPATLRAVKRIQEARDA